MTNLKPEKKEYGFVPQEKPAEPKKNEKGFVTSPPPKPPQNPKPEQEKK